MFKYPFYWSELVESKLYGVSNLARKSDQSINVVMASDYNFLKYTAVAIKSIIANHKKEKRINFFLLEEKLMQEIDREKYLSIIGDRGVLHEIPVDAEVYHNLRTTPGISVATYFRLKMDEILPSSLYKIVYLDSDIIVCDDIEDLFEIDMGDCILCGVEDSIAKSYIKKFSQKTNSKHINAGVMLVNLQKLREIGFQNILEDYLKSKKYTLMLGDQEILNGIFGEVIGYIPVRWNLHGSMFDPTWRSKNVSKNNTFKKGEIEKAIDNPGIIHYTYKRKPWVSGDHPKTDLWHKYASMTPYKKEF